MIWTIIGSSAACLTMLAFIPQIIKALKTKSVQDISPVSLLQFTLGVSLWIIYGASRKDPIIIIANSVTLLSLITLLSIYLKYKPKKYENN
jgi:MtN3 and saliva related transmembrane protein